MRSNHLIAAVLMAFFGGALPSAEAEAPLDIPLTAPHILADMQKTHVNFKVTPNDDAALAYTLAIPKAWVYSKKFGPVPGGPLTTQGLGFFAAAAKEDTPVIAVTVTASPHEIPIDAWVRGSLMREGWRVLAGQWFPGPHGLFYEVTGTRVVKGNEEVRRTSVRADGGRIFSVNCLSARKHWDDVKETFWAAHVTFELLKPSQEDHMEIWRRATAKEPDFEAAYPGSWTAEAVVAKDEGISAVDIRLLDDRQQTLLAYLQIKTQKGRDSLPKLQEAALAKLRKAGFIPIGVPRPLSEQDDPRSVAVKGWLGGFAGKARRDNVEVTIRTGFVAKPGLTFSFSLISPTIADDNLVALRAQRAFEIARSTIAPVK